MAVEDMVDGMEVFWGAPSADQAGTALGEMRRMVGDVAKIVQSPHPSITLPRGGRILLRSLDDPHAARSKTADRLYVDEAALVKPWAWHEVLRPILSSTGGGAWFGTTPMGLNWFWEEWTAADAGVAADSAAWRAPVLGADVVDGELVRAPHPLENDRFSWAELEAIWSSPRMTERTFRQEYLAEFVDSGDAVFASADISALAVGWTGEAEPVAGKRYLSAWDLGRRRDATVGITVDWTAVPYQVVAFDRVLGVPWPRIQAMIAERHRAYGGRTVVECNGVGDPVLENLDVRAEPFTTTAKSKVAAITALQFLAETGTLKLGQRAILDELRAYQWDDRAIVQDCVMALAIAAASLPAPERSRRVSGAALDAAVVRTDRPSLTYSEMEW